MSLDPGNPRRAPPGDHRVAKSKRQLLRVTLLGEFSIWHGETALTLNTPSHQALLSYLLLHPDQRRTRQHLAFTFWPESTEKQARTNLRKALFHLRRTLPDPDLFLQADLQHISWRPSAPYELDVAAFEAAAQNAKQASAPGQQEHWLNQAVDLYAGELLPDLYHDWIVARREALRQQYLACLTRLIELAQNGCDYVTAGEYARRLLREDPLHEATYRSLMRLQALAGNRAGALRTYHTCATRLQRTLGVSPSPATEETYRRLLDLQTPIIRSLPERVPLVARERSWATLQRCWQQATGQRPLLALIRGEAGIGKTRLAEELLDWTTRQGVTTLRTACYAAAGTLPYAPVADWLRSEVMQKPLSGLADKWLLEISRVVPELLVQRPQLSPPGPITESWQQQHLFTALATAVFSANQPVLLFIDNLQWCDSDTLAWLCFLLRYDPQARCLLLGSVRTGAVRTDHRLSALCHDMRRYGRLVEIDLGRLDEPATTTMVTQITGQVPDAVQSADFFAETEGVPLFIVEMARAGIQSADSDQRAPDRSEGVRPELPDKVRGVIEERLANLSPAAQELAGVAAVTGRSFTYDLLVNTSGETETTLMPALDELWQLRIIQEQGADAYDFSHDKIRQVVYGALSAARRRVLHGRIAAALETLYHSDLDAISSKIAAHWEAAGKAAQAVAYYQRAAMVAQAVYANQETIEYLRQAIDLFPHGDVAPQLQVEIHEQLGDVLVTVGQYEEAESALKNAVSVCGEALHQARLYRKIANTYQLRRRHDEAMAVWNTAESCLGSFSDNGSPAFWQEWLWIQLDKSWLLYWTDQTDALKILLEGIASDLEAHGTTSQKGVYYHRLVILALRRERYFLSDETIRYARKSFAMTQQSGTPNQIAFAQFALGLTLFYQGWEGNPVEGEFHMRSALELAEEIGDVMVQLRCLVHLSQNYLRQRAADAARSYLSRATALAQKVNVLEYVVVTEGLNALRAWRDGDLARTQQAGENALAMAAELPFGWPTKWTAVFPLVNVALMQGETGKAISYVHTLLEPGQMRLRDEVTDALQQAIAAWEQNQEDTVCAHLETALKLARAYQYL